MPSNRPRPIHHSNSALNIRSTFQNPWPSASAPTWAELLKLSFPLAWYDSTPPHSTPPPDVKVVDPDWGASDLKSVHQDCVIGTWLGHAGALAEFKSANPTAPSTYVLFDPIFSVRAGPTKFTGPSRLKTSPCRVSELPGCDAVFISHKHYDHLDFSTVVEITKCFPAVKWFVPLRNKAWLVSAGVEAASVVEMDWWDTWEGVGSAMSDTSKVDSEDSTKIRVTCVPAQHNSGRYGVDQGTTLWCGWVVERFKSIEDADGDESETRTNSLYHAGDTGYRRIAKSTDTCPAFKEIGEKFGGFDLSFIPIWRGGTLGFFSYAGFRLMHHQIPSAHHCSPADAVEIHRDVKSRNTIAIHFGTFIGSEAESREAAAEFLGACQESNIDDFQSQIESPNGRAGIVDIGGSLVVAR